MGYDPTVSQPQAIHTTETNRVWVYKSEDSIADISATDYFTDAVELGIQSGDVVLVSGSNGGATVADVTAAPALGGTNNGGNDGFGANQNTGEGVSVPPAP